MGSAYWPVYVKPIVALASFFNGGGELDFQRLRLVLAFDGHAIDGQRRNIQTRSEHQQQL